MQQSKWCTIAVTVNGYQYLSLKYQYQYQYKYTVLQPWYLAYISMRLQHARQRSVPCVVLRCAALRCPIRCERGLKWPFSVQVIYLQAVASSSQQMSVSTKDLSHYVVNNPKPKHNKSENYTFSHEKQITTVQYL